MRFLATLFRNVWRHGDVERDLDEEVRVHFEVLVDEYRAAGMEDAAARRAARVELGGTGQVKDAVRDARRGIWLEHFWQDVRYALRTFRRSPGFAATAVVSLAVGIAAATGLFAAGPWLKPKPRADGDAGGNPFVGRLVQFLTSIYGGFFGAGMGIMMLATLGLTERGDSEPPTPAPDAKPAPHLKSADTTSSTLASAGS